MTFREYMMKQRLKRRNEIQYQIAYRANVAIGTIKFAWRYRNLYPKKTTQKIISDLLNIPINELFPKS